MDAVTFLNARSKMCALIHCGDCGLSNDNNGTRENCDLFTKRNPGQAVAIVEKWLSEHPLVTYASKIREVFPEFDLDDTCLAYVLNVLRSSINCDNYNCKDCWNREYGSLEERHG